MPAAAAMRAGTDASLFEHTLDLELGISHSHRLLNAAVCALAVFVLAILFLSRPAFLIVIVAILMLGHRLDRRITQRSAGAICRLQWRADHSWRWMTADGHWHDGRCISAQRFGTLLVCLTMTDRQRRFRRQPVILFADAMDADSHRRLRARLCVFPPSMHAAED